MGPPPLAKRGRLAFNLENGADVLLTSFGACEVLRYPNGLRVTEVDPVIAYVASMIGANDGLTAVARRVMAGRVREHIEREGAFVISSETGVFQATADAS